LTACWAGEIGRYHNKFPICKSASACLWQIRGGRRSTEIIGMLAMGVTKDGY
jgi:hypothetical protein